MTNSMQAALFENIAKEQLLQEFHQYCIDTIPECRIALYENRFRTMIFDKFDRLSVAFPVDECKKIIRDWFYGLMQKVECNAIFFLCKDKGHSEYAFCYPPHFSHEEKIHMDNMILSSLSARRRTNGQKLLS